MCICPPPTPDPHVMLMHETNHLTSFCCYSALCAVVMFGISNVEHFCCAQAPVARWVQVDANTSSRDLQDIKNKHTDKTLKDLRHPTASSCCFCWTAVVGNDLSPKTVFSMEYASTNVIISRTSFVVAYFRSSIHWNVYVFRGNPFQAHRLEQGYHPTQQVS